MKAVCFDAETLIQVSLDGHTVFDLEASTPIYLKIAEQTLPLLQPKNYNHFYTLRSKLGWGD